MRLVNTLVHTGPNTLNLHATFRKGDGEYLITFWSGEFELEDAYCSDWQKAVRYATERLSTLEQELHSDPGGEAS